MQELHGYTIDETRWETLGGNGECNKTARKGGKRYFIKRVTYPTYPSEHIKDGDFRRSEIQKCNAWLENRKKIIAALPGTGSGNLIKPLEYFREGIHYYEVTYLVDVESISYKDVWKLSAEEKRLMMTTISMILSEMHENGIVHGDLDPENILISHPVNHRNLITKLIDFTDAFFEKNPPDSIMSKEPWWSPEAFLYFKKVEGARELLSCKTDVFSLGVIFHQYCSKGGGFPYCSKEYPWQEFFNGTDKIRLDEGIDASFQDVISRMLKKLPDDRPTMKDVHYQRKSIWNNNK